MRYFLPFYSLLLLLLSFSSLRSQGVLLEGEFVSCDLDSMRLFVLDGGMLYQVASTPLQESEGTYTFGMQIKEIPSGFYLVGGGRQNNTKMLILGPEPKVKLTGSCKELSKASVWHTKINGDYARLIQHLQGYQTENARLITEFRKANSQKKDLASVIQAFKELDNRKLSLLDSLKRNQPLLAKVAAINTYLSFQNHGEGYKDEAEYFAKTFFQQANLKDPQYNYIPALQDAFQQYTSTLSRIGLSNEMQAAFVKMNLNKIPQNSSAARFAFQGLISGFRRSNPDLFVQFAQNYLDLYKGRNPSLSRSLEKEVASLMSRTIGGEAPEITLPTPEGDTLKLSDLRGKVVLVDFWASWCGPCRRENPNVVRMYEKYKDKGFDILGVSLDNNKARWEGAIAKDGLTWKHVSDLKGWRSTAAKKYGVSGIPYTVLLDEEGKIIATKLRGRNLERKLEEILN